MQLNLFALSQRLEMYAIEAYNYDSHRAGLFIYSTSLVLGQPKLDKNLDLF